MIADTVNPYWVIRHTITHVYFGTKSLTSVMLDVVSVIRVGSHNSGSIALLYGFVIDASFETK